MGHRHPGDVQRARRERTRGSRTGIARTASSCAAPTWIVIPDNDPAGRYYADTTASLSRGIAQRIRLLDLAKHWPAIPTGGDVSDWLAAGHTREELDALIALAPEWSLQQADVPQREASEAAPDVGTNESKLRRKAWRRCTRFSKNGSARNTTSTPPPPRLPPRHPSACPAIRCGC